VTTIITIDRPTLIRKMRERDGDMCMHPDCGKPLDYGLIGTENKMEPTIDHWMPQVWCRENDWSFEQIWDIDNLRMMHKQCNAKKGQLIPNEDGTLPAKTRKEFRYRRDRREARPEICTTCNSGRTLDIDQICNVCGGGPNMPFPTLYKVHPSECPHEGPWSCWSCMLEMDIRTPAIVSVLDGEFLDDN
jgi:hypothetical protein